VGERICPNCNTIIKCKSHKRYYVIRNIRNSTKNKIICLKCATSGEKNPFFGKKHAKQTRQKISESRIGKACGAENAMSNIVYKQKISNILKEKYKNGELDWLKNIQKNKIIESRKLGKMKNAPISKAEMEIGHKLKEQKIDFETQFKINTKPFDFFIKQYNLLIEFNGDYFHANPEKYESNYFNKKKKMFALELWELDKTKKQEAIDNGYNFLTIWESDYKKDKDGFINKILNYAKK
jgi:very-short-patch-repair endonuclease